MVDWNYIVGSYPTFQNIAAEAGGRAGAVPSGTLSPVLHRLVREKQVLAVAEPLSTRPGKPALYWVADSNLRLYLGIMREVHQHVLRGRVTAARQILARRWSSWRGHAVEPLVREALTNAAAAGALPWPQVQVVGGWWNRQFQPEVDLVGADRGPVAGQVAFAGSVKWLDSPFDERDLQTLRRDAGLVPGFDPAAAGLVVVSRAGANVPANAVDVTWGPRDIVSAWA